MGFLSGLSPFSACKVHDGTWQDFTVLLWRAYEGHFSNVKYTHYIPFWQHLLIVVYSLICRRVEEETGRVTSVKVAPQLQESSSSSTKSASKQQLPQQPTDSPIRRRRREPNNNGHWVQDENKKTNEFEMQHQSKKSTIRDPLHWFGLLVSPSLRASQDHFKTGK